MKNFKNIAMLTGGLMLALTACKKEETTENPTPAKAGKFVLEIEHVWGHNEDAFLLNTALTHPMTGDEMTFSTMKYYVSNIKLTDTDGNVWTQDESYFLVDLSQPESLEMTMADVPAADYVAMEITFGVDSLHNVSGAQTGALSIANNMFWSWNNGYIMIKAEGQSPQSASGSFSYHLGGFTGKDKSVNTLNLSFSGTPMRISANATPQIHMKANPARLWHTYGSVSNGENIHMPGENAGIMATDFQTTIYIDHIHN